ncbi:MAG: hypothetical protein IH592_10085 [Bacteroidales bacterium]|nr:hypothetical protein [Bacteroidales bacterium]
MEKGSGLNLKNHFHRAKENKHILRIRFSCGKEGRLMPKIMVHESEFEYICASLFIGFI